MVSGHAYGRLCEDCVAILFHGESTVRDHQSGHVRLTDTQQQEVA